MPINPKLKEQLTTMPMDEKYRAELLATLDNAPADVQNLWMGQAEVTRQLNEIKTTQGDWKVKADKFYTDSNASIDGWKSEVTKANDALKAAQARITELEAGGGAGAGAGGGAPDAGTLKEIAGLKTLIQQLETKLPQNVITEDKLNEHLGRAYQSAVGFIGEQTIKIRAIEKRHEATFGANTFGEKETEELIKYANELSTAEGRRIGLEDAYTKKYGTELQKKHDDQVGAAAVESFKTTQGAPGGAGPAGPGAPERGPLQIRLDELANRDSGAKDGVGFRDWREASAAAADELVKEGKY